LIQALQARTVGSPEQRALQTWIETRRKEQPTVAESWFLTDAKGVQIARDPFNEQTLFGNFSERTYFHGGATSLSAADKERGIKPISHVTLSAVYMSTATRSLKVAFSAPVWEDKQLRQECLGVIGMSVELGAFYELQTGLDAGQIAVLVDTREDNIEGKPASGLILHHPSLQEAQRKRLAAGNESLFRISPKLVERLRKLREIRSRNSGLTSSSADIAESIDTAYIDPVAPAGSPPVLAAFEPVRIDSRPPDVRDTGWVVIIQETPLSGK
jgi:hypothetical protein